MRRWFITVLATLSVAVLGGVSAPLLPTAAAADIPIGRLGETLRVQNGDMIADVTVRSIVPSEIPPGFGYPPRPPRHQVWKAEVVVQAVQVPNPYALATSLVFNGVTPTGDAYQPRNSDGPEALKNTLNNAPQGSTVAGFVYWDCYRDLVSNVVITDKTSGIRLAQWNV
ncbi:hypothetical protein MCHIJ_43400 [Mycolicibacterium chitae]|uniref:Exported alanine and valine rich protein n=1 Tax=Mycolicibacterium chitae TaxID=1792 RepID=A0A3S4SA48_MYCCI|nr:DUF1942 domain-containing protein [Mycolicibacterium chitae]BBZ04903.1 hypothetical protein MCHIJ_43400 [Mycolicibacterium chitae]VEG48526.1 exported alanine and valine rich protein [Mycolicibacterium chitae]